MSELVAIPGYDVERLLGEGAYGRVFLAREREGLKRPVALKLFARERRADFDREVDMTGRIEEARRAARAEGLVQALGTGEVEGQGFIALQWLEGGSLADLVAREGPLPHARAADLVAQAARALQVLHGAGIFHRDVKPQNLLLGADGRVSLGDFGLSRALSGSLSAAGSPAFAAPEVIAGRPIDGRRADVYSLGATLSYLITGETMLPGRPDLFALERRGVPRPLQEAVLQATVTDPQERFADVSAFLAGLENSLRTSSDVRDGTSMGTIPAGGTTVKNTYANQPVDSLSDILDPPPPPCTSRRAVGSLISALLVFPLLVVVAGLLIFTATPDGPGRSFTSWDEVDPATGRQVYFMEYSTGDAPPQRLGPSPTPLDWSDVPAPPEDPAAQAEKVAAVLLLLTPLGLEVLAILLGISALRLIESSAGALTGRGYAIGGLVIAGINVVILLLGGAALALLVVRM